VQFFAGNDFHANAFGHQLTMKSFGQLHGVPILRSVILPDEQYHVFLLR